MYTKKQVLNDMVNYLPDLRKGQFADGDIEIGTELFGPKTIIISAATAAKLGSSGAGWVVNAADDVALLTLPASQTAETAVIPLTGLPVGWTITGFKVLGQIESAGGAVTLDADLHRHEVAAGDVTDTTVDSITQIAVAVDTAVNNGLSQLTEAIEADRTHFVVLTGTTAALTDIAIMGIAVTIEKL